MYSARKRFLFWLVYLPFGVILSVYFFQVLLRTNRWLTAEPDSEKASAKYVFWDVYDSFGQMLQNMSTGFIIFLIICMGLWLYEYYSVKKEIKNANSEH